MCKEQLLLSNTLTHKGIFTFVCESFWSPRVIISPPHTLTTSKDYLKREKLINTVAAAGAWILANQRQSAGSWFLWSPGLFSRATVSTGRQTIAAVETLHSCYCLAAARHGSSAATRPADGRTAQIFSDCAITKYFSHATAFTVNTSTHPGDRAITAN